MSDTAAQPATQPTRVLGFVDAIDQGRVYGWAWQPDAPSARLEVEIMVEDRILATGVADKMRPDLVENHIGDGAHAFEVPVTLGEEGAPADRIAVFVRIGSGERVALMRREEPRRDVSDPRTLKVIAEALSELGKGQRALARTAVTKLARIETKGAGSVPPEALTALEAMIADVRAAQEKLEQRVGEIDVFMMRLDTTFRTIDEKLAEMRRGPGMSRGGWWIVGAVLGATLVIGATIIALWR